MSLPFELEPQDLDRNLEELVDGVFASLQSQFLVLPRGRAFVEYSLFQTAYEALKRWTNSFYAFDAAAVWDAMREQAFCFGVLRSILGMSPPEWSDLAKAEHGLDIPQGFVRHLDLRCRLDDAYISRLSRPRNSASLDRLEALIATAMDVITKGAPPGAVDTVHRLNKVDTAEGLDSLRYVASQHVPYAMLLYERYLGRPFATHRDSVSELVGDVMESAIEERLTRARITFRRTGRAERVPGFDQAPDFFVPDEFNPAVVIEAKITGDDGTARDKVTRILRLTWMRDERLSQGLPSFQVVACIDGRGFGIRREDMRNLILATEGKIFTLATLDRLVEHTRLREFLPHSHL